MNTYSRTALLVICIFAGGFPFFYGQSSASEIGSKAQANDLNEQAFRVGVKPTSPFVMIDENTGELTGFSIDIIREILIDLEQWDETEFVIHDDLEEHLNAVARGDVDFGIAATSITSNREKRLDFSIPIFQGRLGIASPQENSIHPALEAIFTWEIGGTALLMVSFLLICANLVWATERGQEHSFDDSWRVGVGQALWWTIVTMTTVGYGCEERSTLLAAYRENLVGQTCRNNNFRTHAANC